MVPTAIRNHGWPGSFGADGSVERLAGGIWEFGYWYGRPYWGQGYATEAGRPVLRFAFDDLGAGRITRGCVVFG